MFILLGWKKNYILIFFNDLLLGHKTGIKLFKKVTYECINISIMFTKELAFEK